jgi:hypothetical protein
MIKIDINNVLFTKSFLELKYKTKIENAIKNIKKKYESSKLEFLDVDKNKDLSKIEFYVAETKSKYDNVVVLGIG